MELDHDVMLVLVTALATILASILASAATQLLIARKERKQYLKDRVWEPLMDLAASVSELKYHINHSHIKEITDLKRIDIPYQPIQNCYTTMGLSKPYVYLSNNDKMIGYFNQLDSSLAYVVEHYHQENWNQNCNTTLIKGIEEMEGLYESIIRYLQS